MPLPSSPQRGRGSQIAKIKVAAGETKPVKITGAFLYVISAPPGIQVRLQDEQFVDASQGTSLECVDGAFFEWFEVKNPGAAAVTVRIYAGFAKFEEVSFAVIEPPTESVGETLTEVPATTSIPIAAVLTGERLQRKAVTIVNRDPNSELELRDSVGTNVIGVIFPQSTQIYHVSDTVNLRNDTGAPIAAAVGQIYWLRA